MEKQKSNMPRLRHHVVLEKQFIGRPQPRANTTIKLHVTRALLFFTLVIITTVVIAVPASLQFDRSNYIINESGSSDGSFATFAVTRTDNSIGEVTVNYATSDVTATAGSDYTSTSGTLTWVNGNSDTKIVQVPIIVDSINEGDETISLTLSLPTGDASLGTPDTATITIENNCGPGSHWVDDCLAGIDTMNNTTAAMVIQIPCETTSIQLSPSGPTIVERQDASTTLDHSINTEMVSMVLTGGGITVKAGINEGVAISSIGKITEQVNNATKADSFFDIYFEVNVPSLGILHNKNGEPMNVATVIDKVPPLENQYESPAGPPLYLYNSDETMILGCLIHTKHQVNKPTLVTLVENSFTATPQESDVLIQWKTATEIDNYGFNIWRSEQQNAEDTKITSYLIFAEGSGSTYNYTDTTVLNETPYWYKLEDIDLNGISTFHDPVSVTLASAVSNKMGVKSPTDKEANSFMNGGSGAFSWWLMVILIFISFGHYRQIAKNQRQYNTVSHEIHQ